MTESDKINIANLLRKGAETMIEQEEYRWNNTNTMRSWEEWRSEYNKNLFLEMILQADTLDGKETWLE